MSERSEREKEGWGVALRADDGRSRGGDAGRQRSVRQVYKNKIKTLDLDCPGSQRWPRGAAVCRLPLAVTAA